MRVNTVICPKSGIPMEGMCPPAECESCGWNPEVNAARRQQIHWYAKHKLMHLWGREDQLNCGSEEARKAIKWLKLELARIVTEVRP